MRYALAVVLVFLFTGCQSLVVVRGPNRNTSHVVVEVDYTTAQPPGQSLLNATVGNMANICDPSVQVSFVVDDNLAGQGHTTWSDSDVRSFATAHHDNPDHFYLIWADGTWANQPAVGGYSWDKRCMAIFTPATGTSGGGVQIAMVHEWCHTLGLVDKFLQMQESHKNAYGNHCDQPGCLMLAATYGSMPCSKCMADLEAGVEK